MSHTVVRVAVPQGAAICFDGHGSTTLNPMNQGCDAGVSDTLEPGTCLPVATQMAIDSFLLSQAGSTERLIFRTYAMSPAAVTIGRHQRWSKVIDELACTEYGWEWCRRPTGGGALLHKNELNYAVIAPRGALARVGEGEFRIVFDRIGRALTATLDGMGFDPEFHFGDRAALSSQHGLCGRSITGNEIALNGRKIVAAAQMITPTGILQHGTVYLNAPTSTDRFWPLTDGMEREDGTAQRWADLGPRFAGRSRVEVAALLESAFGQNIHTQCHPCQLTVADWLVIEAKINEWATAGWDKSR